MDELNTENIMHKNFGIERDEFDYMVSKLRFGNEEMFEMIFLKHFGSCMDYLKYNYNASQEEAYDISMDTLIDFRKSLIESKIQYGNLRYLFTKMAIQRLLRFRKKNQKIETRAELPEIQDFIDLDSAEELVLLDKSWAKLGSDCKNLLMQYYYLKVKLNVIALEKEISPGAVRKQKERCVNKLQMNFKQYGFN